MKYGDALIASLGGGVIISIFLGNGMLEASYSLYSTDFETMARSMAKVPKIQRAVIERVAFQAWLNVSSNKEKLFWRAVLKGCNL